MQKVEFVRNSSRGRKIHDVYSYSKNDKLGQGSYGMVYKAVHKETGIPRAVKIIHKPSIKQKERLECELRTMELLDHPHVIRVFETYEDEEHIYILLEICNGGDIFDKVLELGNFQEQEALIIFAQIVRSIHYYQNLRLVHRDLKPENFLFQNKNQLDSLYIIDFGLARKFELGVQHMWTKAGTAYYVAPEVLQGKYDNRCDIWSAGVILYVLLCGYPPFYGETESEILYQIQRGKYEFDGVEWKLVSPQVKELISHMLTKAEQRYSTQQILDHEWVRGFAQPGQCLLTKEQIQLWITYPVIKKLDQYLLTDIKNSFLLLNKSQTGILSSQEIDDALQFKCNDLEYNQFIAICLNKAIYTQDKYMKLMFYFLAHDGQINKASLSAINIDLDVSFDYQQFTQLFQ